VLKILLIFYIYINQQKSISSYKELYSVGIHASQMFARGNICAIHRLRRHESESPVLLSPCSTKLDPIFVSLDDMASITSHTFASSHLLLH